MKAIVYFKYGPPEVLHLVEVPKPSPGPDEVLVKIHAAAVNPLDWHAMRAAPFVVRFYSGLFKPKHKVLGADIAGRVEAVGGNVEHIHAGDEVYGDISRGGFAEYVCVHENKLVLKPANLSFLEAAAVPVAGLTALQCLRDQMSIQSGQKVLINGASGGVGTFAVQIAKAFGAEVTGVCSTGNVSMVRSIGADHAIDYTNEDFTRNGQQYDLILDNVGNRTIPDLKRILAPDGTYNLCGYSMSLMLRLMFRSKKSNPRGQTIRNSDIAKANEPDLEFMKELIEADKVAPVIDRVYPMSDCSKSMGYLEEGHARGKVVLSWAEENQS